MKHFALTLALTLSSAQAMAITVLVCDGKVGEQDISVVDDNTVVGIWKGKVDIAAGQRGNNFPFARFSGEEVQFDAAAGTCELSIESSKGGFSLELPCTGAGPAVMKDLDVPSLGLTAPLTNLTCRLEDYTPRQQETVLGRHRPTQNY